MRAIFGAFQRGLNRGREAPPQEGATPPGSPERTDTDEGTCSDDAR
jgi:hypothetical protein